MADPNAFSPEMLSRLMQFSRQLPSQSGYSEDYGYASGPAPLASPGANMVGNGIASAALAGATGLAATEPSMMGKLLAPYLGLGAATHGMQAYDNYQQLRGNYPNQRGIDDHMASERARLARKAPMP